MSNFPQYLQYFCREFAGVSTATFRVPPQASAALEAHRSMTFNLPTNTLVSMKDVRLVFSASAVANGTSKAARLPKASALIEKISVTAGGISVDAGVQNQNALQQALDNMKVREVDPVDSHSQMYRNVSGVSLAKFGGANGVAANTVAETYTSNNNATQFSVSLGNFFETISPNMLDLSLIAEIQVQIFLAGNAVITSGKGALIATGANSFIEAGNAQATYTVSNYQLLVPCYSINDGTYQKVLGARMNDVGYLECMWKGYDSFSDTWNGSTTRCASAASSLDKIITVWRSDGYNGVKGAIPIAGTNKLLQKGDSGEALIEADVLDQPDCRGGAEFLCAPMNFTAPMAALPSSGAPNPQEPELQYAINSVQYPQFSAPLSQWYQLTKDAFEVNSTQSKSYIEYLSNRFVMAVSLNLPQSTLLRAKSGLDCRGSNSFITTSNVTGVTMAANANVLTYLESSRVMRLGAGRTLQVIL